jgi:hypothetical protein
VFVRSDAHPEVERADVDGFRSAGASDSLDSPTGMRWRRDLELGNAAGSRRQVPEAVATDAPRPSEPANGADREVDDIRMLLRELRLRRQLRAARK